MTIIKDNQEKLAELLATFTPEEMEQYNLALGIFDDITKEMAYEEMKKLGISDFHITGVDLNEKGEFAKVLTYLDAIKTNETKENNNG